MSTWLYQFWFFSFKTAKHWGKGPRDWTANILGFDNHSQQGTIVYTSPGSSRDVNTPSSQSTPGAYATGGSSVEDSITPTSLCRWSIHCDEIPYEHIPSPPASPTQHFSAKDEQSWPSWPGNITAADNFTEKLCQNLESNQFSSLDPGEVPIGMKQVAVAVRHSPDELFKESLGFCIMSRNAELLTNLFERYWEWPQEADIFPLHLAASYLDGATNCCIIFSNLLQHVPVHRLYRNNLGHTILDQLMITILKAHSSCAPSVIDEALGNTKRFEGEDVDICGRWDADSECIRKRLANGTPKIPFDWKHMFCHTSAQAICHCIQLFFSAGGYLIDAESGLFLHRCFNCGLKLQLSALHTLLMVAYYLSIAGCRDETLFGIVACLVCMLQGGSNPRVTANISLELLLGQAEADECTHHRMDPCRLAKQIVARASQPWSGNIVKAWEVMIRILTDSQVHWRSEVSDEERLPAEPPYDVDIDIFIEYDGDNHSVSDIYDQSDENSDDRFRHECSVTRFHYNCLGSSRILAPLWAAIQTELLTYRRQNEGDPWISRRFDMDVLHQSLIHDNQVAIALVQDDMMKPFCSCGKFIEYHSEIPTIQEATRYYFSNMDDWSRTSFLNVVDIEER